MCLSLEAGDKINVGGGESRERPTVPSRQGTSLRKRLLWLGAALCRRATLPIPSITGGEHPKPAGTRD